MSDLNAPKGAVSDMSKSPPPAYSEATSQPVTAYGGPPPMTYPGAPEQGYPHTPFNQPYMAVSSYQHAASGQTSTEALGKNPEMMGPSYPPPPPAPYPPQVQYPPAVPYSQELPVYTQGQALLPGVYPQGPYPPGTYTQIPYGHPTAAVVVTQPCGRTVVVAQAPPPDNMVLSWLACLFCFCPIGFFAVMNSWQAKRANETHDFQAAAKYGAKAKRLAIISIVFGVIILILCIILRIILYTSYSTASY